MAHLLEGLQAMVHLLGRSGIARSDATLERRKTLEFLSDQFGLVGFGARVQRPVERLERVLRPFEAETRSDRREGQPG